MKTIEELRDLMGETEERMYAGMPMADLFAIFIERMCDVEARSNDLHVRVFERIDSLDKLTQELYRMMKDLQQGAIKKKPALPHWSDLPRFNRS